MILYALGMALASEGDTQNSDNADYTAQHQQELRRHQRGQPIALVMHVVLDDHLNSQDGMVESEGQKQHQQRGIERARDPRRELGMIIAGDEDQRDNEPQRQRDQRGRSGPLKPPVMSSLLGGAEAPDMTKRCAKPHTISPFRWRSARSE